MDIKLVFKVLKERNTAKGGIVVDFCHMVVLLQGFWQKVTKRLQNKEISVRIT